VDTRSIILPQNITSKHCRSVFGHFGSTTEVSGHFGSTAEVSLCRNVLLPKCPVTVSDLLSLYCSFFFFYCGCLYGE